MYIFSIEIKHIHIHTQLMNNLKLLGKMVICIYSIK